MSIFLVTGGAGFIGSNIINGLLSDGHEVRALDNFSTGKRKNIAPFLSNPLFRFYEADLRHKESLDPAVQGVDFILHQGALPSVPRSIEDPITTNNVNVLGTLNILESARQYQVKRVVFASSSSIYGNSPTLPKVEEMPISPLSPYALAKYTAERYCQLYYQIYGLETVCLRYFNVFGPNQDPTSQYSAVIPKFIRGIAKGEPPVIFGDGLQSRDFTYVENNVTANLTACFTRGVAGEVFNIACGQSYTLLDLVNALNELLGRHVVPRFEPQRCGEVKHSLASIDKAKNMLKFEPAVHFMEGLSRTVKSFGLGKLN